MPNNIMRVFQQPNGARYGAPLAVQPIIQVGYVDTQNNNNFIIDTTFSGSVSVFEGAGNTGYNINGLKSVPFINGVATFTNLELVADSTNTTLDVRPASFAFTNDVLNTVNSNEFTISNASKLIITSTPIPTTAISNRPLRWPITVQLADPDDEPVPLPSVAISSSATGAILTGTTTGSTNSTGNVTFSNLILGNGTQAILTFSALGVQSVSITIDISLVDIIKPKRSEVTGKLPTTDDLVEYEIALNIPDKKIFVKDSKNNIQVVASVDVPPVTSVAGKTGAVTLNLNDLTDVDTVTTAPTQGQTLTWDAVTSNWLPTSSLNQVVSSTLTITNAKGPTATLNLESLTNVAGTYGSNTKITPLTIDTYGRVSSVGTAQNLTPDWIHITSKPTTLEGYGITNAQPLDTDLTKISTLAGTNGFLKKTATDTWTLDTSTYLTGNQSISLTGDATGSGATSISVTLANSGVTAGTYKSVTVDAKGRVTSATNPTTLSGFGITDAQPLDADLSAIAALTGSSGILKKTAVDTWSLDTSSYLTGNQTITLSGDASGSGSTSISITLANSGVTAGTYNSVTVDAKGRVTSGSNPTTLAGHGITDGVLTTDSRLSDARTPLAHNQAWSTITSTPTTLSGYGITDAVSSSLVGAKNGIATLDASGLVTASQLPSYVDDVVEYANLASFPATGETGKIYVDIATVKIYRWSGSAYIEISPVAGTIDAATRLATARTISLTTDVTGSVSFDGTTNVSIATTLANSGVTAGTYNNVLVNSKGIVTSGSNVAYLTSNQNITFSGDVTGSGSTTVALTLANSGVTAPGPYTKVTVDAKGRVTSGSNPTTLADYGITDAALSTHTHTFASLTSKPTTLSGYGITDAASSSHTHTFASLTSKPTTIAGYGITDAYTKTELYNTTEVDNLIAGISIDWSEITSIPTTLIGISSGVYDDVVTVAQTEIASALPSASVSYANTAGDASTADYIAVTDDTAGVSTLYPLLTTTNSGDVLVNTSSTQISFVPSTGTLTAVKFSGNGASLTSLAASNISSGTLAIARGGTNGSATPTQGGLAYGTGTAYAFTSAGTSGQLLQSNGTSAPSWINSSSLIPVGSVQMYAGSNLSTPPSGWLFCQGQTVSRTVYAALFSAIGTVYGSGDGSTTFHLPNLMGNVAVGYKSGDTNFGTMGKTAGSATVTLDSTHMPTHSHTVTNGSNRTYWNNNGNNPWTWAYNNPGAIGSDTNPSTSTAGSSQPHSNLQPYIVLNYIIKV
jgi:microcystin-dependent protein/phage-related tail fiber protein